MRRRDFITLLGGTAAGWPLAAHPQRPVPVIGWLSSGSKDGDADALRAFRQGLGEAGFDDRSNAAIEYRWSEGRSDRLAAMATELVRSQVSVIASAGAAATRAAKAATDIIPVVFQMAADPVREGLVASLNRPGGNLTGTTSLATGLGPKRLELLHEAVPGATVIAVLVNPFNTVLETQSKDLQGAAHALGLQLRFMEARPESDIDSVFGTAARLKPSALMISTDLYFLARTAQLAALAARHAIPTIYSSREFAAAGGLMGYGTSLGEGYRLAGGYVGRILKGDKPADLPVQQSTKVDLIINLKTAKSLGLTMPLALLARADEVIE